MIDRNDERFIEIMGLTTDIVTAYVGNHKVEIEDINGLIQSIYASLECLAAGQPVVGSQTPAVAIEESITPDYIICLEDGRKLKMLKRHLRTAYSMTPEQYRAKWGLNADYPMVAPNYAIQRSKFAKEIGLGRSSKGGRKKIA